MTMSSTFARRSVVPEQTKRNSTGPSTFAVAELVVRLVTPALETDAMVVQALVPFLYCAAIVIPASVP